MKLKHIFLYQLGNNENHTDKNFKISVTVLSLLDALMCGFHTYWLIYQNPHNLHSKIC